ncbi:aldehyde dehydrogenase family protein [Methanomassiliicoccus luminyensis]|nr:aldehyde dehydrogenase family protein [Methanomassiliicoccus luminyensis]
MPFMNEETYEREASEGGEAAFHTAYERAAEEVLSSGGTEHPNHIGGRAARGKMFKDLSPTDESRVVGTFGLGNADEAREAVRSCREAFPSWSGTDWMERVRIFERAAGIMRERKYELAASLTLDNGKNRHEAMGEVDEAIDFMEYYGREMRRNDGYEVARDAPYPDEEVRLKLRPYGVWAVICPFNFPLSITAGMTTAALITGNTVVLKPTSSAPLPACQFFDVMVEAGMPPGALNLVAGPGEGVGDALVGNKDVDGVVFTGSQSVGESIMRNPPRPGQRPVIAEMGSKNPIIVTASADLEAAADGVAASAFGYSGQKCSACSRVYVESSVKDRFTDMLVERAEEMAVGDPFDKGTYMGPVITRKAMDDFVKWSELGRRDGRVRVGGRRVEGGLSHGYYVAPTIIDGLPEGHELMRRELFVPILCVQGFGSLDDAIRRANDTEFGLTAGIFTGSEAEAESFFDRADFGVVYANRRRGGTTGAMVGGQSFVGWKASGSTGKGTGGPHYLPQFMREQSRTMVR